MPDLETELGWSWFDPVRAASADDDVVQKAATACFAGRQGAILMRHLEAMFLDRRMPATATDAELRHLEGQRTAIDYLKRLAHPKG